MRKPSESLQHNNMLSGFARPAMRAIPKFFGSAQRMSWCIPPRQMDTPRKAPERSLEKNGTYPESRMS